MRDQLTQSDIDKMQEELAAARRAADIIPVQEKLQDNQKHRNDMLGARMELDEKIRLQEQAAEAAGTLGLYILVKGNTLSPDLLISGENTAHGRERNSSSWQNLSSG